MSASDFVDMKENPDWFQRISDRANAILIKETRQALKSKQFIATFLLMLVGAWLVSVFGMLNSGPALEYGATGPTFFFAFYVVLIVATVLIVPFGAFNSLMQEHSLGTFDLLNITTLSPRQIVWGKLLSAVVQLFIFYSAITPFIAFASLLQGFDAPTAAFLLVVTFFSSILLCMFTLMLSSMSDSKKSSQGIVTVMVLGGLAFMVIYLCVFSGGLIYTAEVPFDDPTFWWTTLFSFLGGISYFVLFQQVTTSRLTFEAGNRSSGIRLICMAQFLILWICFIIAVAWISTLPPGGMAGTVTVLSIISCLHWGAIGLFTSTEENFLSRRVRRDLPENKGLRTLYAPFLPGGSRGYLFVMGNLFLLWWVAVLCLANMNLGAGGGFSTAKTVGDYLTLAAFLEFDRWDQHLLFIVGLIFYLTIYMGVAAALGRWGMRMSESIMPAHVRVVTALLALAGILIPYILVATEFIRQRPYTMYFLLNPFETLNNLSGMNLGMRQTVMTSLAVLAALSVLVNAKAAYDSVVDVVKSRVRPRRMVPPQV